MYVSPETRQTEKDSIKTTESSSPSASSSSRSSPNTGSSIILSSSTNASIASNSTLNSTPSPTPSPTSNSNSSSNSSPISSSAPSSSSISGSSESRDQLIVLNTQNQTGFREGGFDQNDPNLTAKSFDLRREGDMMISKRRNPHGGRRIRLWPDGRVPYILSNEYTQKARAVIMEVFETFHSNTCIKFTPRQPIDRYFIKIVPEEKCQSEVGMRSPGQLVVLGGMCLGQKGLIEHELMHTLGFYGHEHQRRDRDKWIKINWQNIPQKSQKFFKQFKRSSILDTGPYNYLSVLHFKNEPFQLDGEKGSGSPFTLPQSIQKVGGENLSQLDIQRIKKLYRCSEEGTVPITLQRHSDIMIM